MSAPPSMEQLCDDLRAEHDWLRGQVTRLDESGLDLPTPAAWTIRDQLTHLAYFDDRAVQAAVDPDEFARDVERAFADFGAYEVAHLEVGRSKSPVELIGWFSGARERLLDLFSRIDPKERLPWYGPPMSARSSATARFMETWAHGLDVADALNVEKPVHANVRHICELGYRTRTFSYQLRDRPEPEQAVRLVLTAPGGGTWEWGDSDAGGTIVGPAADFAMVVTQRRNLADTTLRVEGGAAAEWISIAQCFAGPPGPGRQPRS